MQLNIPFNMPAGDGAKTFEVGTQFSFISFVNPTDNSMELYAGAVALDYADIRNAIAFCPKNQAITFPIVSGYTNQYTLVWRDGGAIVPGGKNFMMIASTVNLGINGQFGSADTDNISIVSDSVGLARMSQLPSALDGSGNLKVSVQSLPEGGSESNPLYVNPNNVDTDPLFVKPVGNDSTHPYYVDIGNDSANPLFVETVGNDQASPLWVRQATIPDVQLVGLGGAMFSKASAGDVVVDTQFRKIMGCCVATSGVTVIIKDAAGNELWCANTNLFTPLEADGITLNFSAAGKAFLLYG